MTAQASLFDSTAGRVSPSRRSDPATSHQAARVNQEGRQSQSARLLAAYVRAGYAGLTDEAAGRIAGVERIADTRRCSELRKAGLIAPTGQTLALSTGCQGQVCAITEAGRKAAGR